MESTIAGLASAASTAISSVASSAHSPGVSNVIKKMLYRAAGEEGLAENVNDVYSASAGSPELPKFSSAPVQQYHIEYQTVPCMDTSGQTFAIWLNVFYLTPLTVLFVRFFIKSYLGMNKKRSKRTSHMVEKAGKDAVKGIEREIYRNGESNGHANGGMNGKTNGKH